MVEYRVQVFEKKTVWYNLDGKQHRKDGPTVEWSNGDKEWWIDGHRRRIEYSDGRKEWFI